MSIYIYHIIQSSYMYDQLHGRSVIRTLNALLELDFYDLGKKDAS